jgi:hypothetical protein
MRTDGRTCPGNIDASGQRQRRIVGLASLLVAAGFSVPAVVHAWPAAVRAFAGVPVFVAALGLFQARAHT